MNSENFFEELTKDFSPKIFADVDCGIREM
jgi:hypothetical protein